MRKITLICCLLLSVMGCKEDDAVASEISKIETNVVVERFDRAFASATPEDLPKLKRTFPFLFHRSYPDSIWVKRMKDTIQQDLNEATANVFGDFKEETEDIDDFFKHMKYYDHSFSEPRIITLTNFVDYRNKLVATDTIVLIALDNYLGSDHEFYGNIPRYIAKNLKPSQIVVDLAKAYSEKQIFQTQKKTLLDDMVYFGKQLYFLNKVLPFKTDAEKIGYTPEELVFAQNNEAMIWTFFVEHEMLFDTDSSLAARFIADAPFSKFYLELDRETPGRLGQYIGWQIVRAYMENNEVPWQTMMQTDATEIFNKSNYKPPK